MSEMNPSSNDLNLAEIHALETRLQSLTPTAAPPALRAQILARMAAEKEAPQEDAKDTPAPARRRPWGWTVAASLLLSVGLNAWATSLDDSRHAQRGSLGVSLAVQETARDVAQIAGPAMGQWVEARLRVAPAPVLSLSRDKWFQLTLPSPVLEKTDENLPQTMRHPLRPAAVRGAYQQRGADCGDWFVA